MFAGVATGVRSAADATTLTDINTGRDETPSSDAAARAIGITTRIVAVLLISCPSTAVSTNSAISNGYGPASPTMVTRPSASLLAAPLTVIAVDSGIIPATS